MQLAPWLLCALFGTVAFLLGVAFFSVHRRHHPRFVLPRTAYVERDLPSLAGLAHGTLESGNKVTLIQNGDAFVRECDALIAGAERTVHLEMYLWKTGVMSGRIVRALCVAARRGVEVRMLVDGIGARMSRAERRELRNAGVELHVLRPLSLRSLGWINNRTHRKILVADGKCAIVGGHCVDDRWLGDARNRREFRDVSVLLQGPVVRQIQAAFCENWVEAAGNVPYGDGVFPVLEARGSVRAHVAYVRPMGGVSSVKLLHHLVIGLANERLWIQTPYFIPDRAARAALIDAAARGVDVRILTAAMGTSDLPIVQHASHYWLASLVDHGVRVYHYQHTLLHQKVWSVDREYALIGTTNFDKRSFDLDDQVTVGVYDPATVKEIDQRFALDLMRADLIDSRRWRRRKPQERLSDALAYLLREQL